MAEKVRGYRCDRETYQAFKDAAKEDGLGIQAWVLKTLKGASGATTGRRQRQFRRRALNYAIQNIESALSNDMDSEIGATTDVTPPARERIV